MSIKILAPVGPINSTNLLYDASGANMISTDSSGNSYSVPVNGGVLAGSNTSGQNTTFNKTSMGYLIGSVNHTSNTASGYILPVADADTYPFLSYICFFKKTVSGATIQPNITCGYNNGTIDTTANYGRRGLTYTGSAWAVTNATSTFILLGYGYSQNAGAFTNACFTTGQAYVKSGAHRTFVHRERYATSTYAHMAIESISWFNTANVLTDIRVNVTANTNLSFWLYQRRY